LDPAGLQDNGGPTKTIALQNTSPAVDQGNPAVFEPTDQRGVTRPQGSAPDMGAFELEQASPTPPPSGSGGCRMGQIEQEPLHSLGNLAVFFFLLALGIFRRLQRLS
jgi:hypothetical protein